MKNNKNSNDKNIDLHVVSEGGELKAAFETKVEANRYAQNLEGEMVRESADEYDIDIDDEDAPENLREAALRDTDPIYVDKISIDKECLSDNYDGDTDKKIEVGNEEYSIDEIIVAYKEGKRIAKEDDDNDYFNDNDIYDDEDDYKDPEEY